VNLRAERDVASASAQPSLFVGSATERPRFKRDSGADAHEVMHEARSSDAVPLRDANVSHQLLLTAWVKRLLSCRVRVWSEALLMRLAVRASRSSAGSYSPQGASNSGSKTTA